MQAPRERGGEEVGRVLTVGCQDVECRVQEARGAGQELAAGVRLAHCVLLCYRASDLMSLHEAVSKVTVCDFLYTLIYYILYIYINIIYYILN